MAAGRLTKAQRERLRQHRERLEREQERLEREERSRPYLELPLPVPREAPRKREEEPDTGSVIIIDLF